MAHFAEIDPNDVVLRVVVIDNKDTSDADGNEVESIGIAYCQHLFGGNWVQTSYNANFRRRYAGIGYTYNRTYDAFIPPKPYPSWTLDETQLCWKSPIPMPNDGTWYTWDEATQSWIPAPIPVTE